MNFVANQYHSDPVTGCLVILSEGMGHGGDGRGVLQRVLLLMYGLAVQGGTASQTVRNTYIKRPRPGSRTRGLLERLIGR
jgi:hypothetical protein